MTSRLKKRPVAGIFHGTMFIGALILIFGHAVYALGIVGIPVYEGWFGFLVMKLGREVGGLMLFTGVAFFLVRRFFAPDRLTAGGKTRPGFERGEAILLLIVVAGFITEGFRLAYESSPDHAEFIGSLVGYALSGIFDAEDNLLGFQAMWWIHGLMGCAFIAMIAHSPFVHMILGPTNSAFAHKRGGINLPAIDFDAMEADESGEEPTFRCFAPEGSHPEKPARCLGLPLVWPLPRGLPRCADRQGSLAEEGDGHLRRIPGAGQV
jgi:hypothetical protein